MDRAKLDTTVEREVHKLINDITEHTYDFVQMVVRRQHPEIPLEQLELILQIVRTAIADGELSKIMFFHERIKTVLDEAVGEENPSPLMEVVPPPPPPHALGKKVTFSV